MADAAAAAVETSNAEESSSWISQSLQQAPPPEPLVSGWILRQSRSMPGTYYHYHQESGFSQWDAPVEREIETNTLPAESAVTHDTNLSENQPSSKRQGAPSEEPSAGLQPPTKRSRPSELKAVRVLHLLKKHKGSRRPASWRNPKITATIEEAATELEEFLAILHESQTPEEMRATFEELARTESDCSSAKRGGDLGYFGRKKMQPAFEKASFALQIGELSGVVETSSGVHILLRIG